MSQTLAKCEEWQRAGKEEPESLQETLLLMHSASDNPQHAQHDTPQHAQQAQHSVSLQEVGGNPKRDKTLKHSCVPGKP